MTVTDRSFYSIRELDRIVRSQQKPLVLWMGAGVSAWRGYPLWKPFAEQMHSAYIRQEPAYRAQVPVALELLDRAKLPEFFSLCSGINPRLYNSMLCATFGSRKTTPIYDRFIKTLQDISPLQILTTNIDESLEKSIQCSTIQGSDLERAIVLLREGESFVCKLHGSISAINSAIFTYEDYVTLKHDRQYLRLLETIFLESTVIFLGYGLSDEYVLKSLFNTNDLFRILSNGPHFVVAQTPPSLLPPTVRTISYDTTLFSDHRSAIKILDMVAVARSPTNIATSSDTLDQPTLNGKEGRYLLGAIFAPGTWNTSQTVSFVGASGVEHSAIIGTGFVSGELPPGLVERSLHDLVVGLICFDKLYIPLSSLGALHNLLGSEVFWILVQESIFRLIQVKSDPSIIYLDKDAVSDGSLSSLTAMSMSSVCEGDLADQDIGAQTPSEVIRKQLHAVEGKEEIAEALFLELDKHVDVLTDADVHISGLVCNALSQPQVARMIGFSDALPPSKVPKWMAFPILRLANLLQIAVICQKLDIVAAKLPFGTGALAGAVFSLTAAHESADNMASYVLTHRFNSDLGRFVLEAPGLISSIIRFRNSAEGESLRRNVLDCLRQNEGGEFVAALGAGLKRNVPLHVLDKAHDQMAGLILASGATRATPALWTDMSNSEMTLALWKRRSANILKEYCVKNRIGVYNLCPCGSGEKLKFCCSSALNL